MTDNSGTRGRSLPAVAPWQLVLAGGLSVLTAASIALVVHTADPAAADTRVGSVRNAVIRLADGTEKAAEAGVLLPRGAQLRTGQDGGAQLVTSGRSVYLGALSTVDVVDGVRQELERGQVMVDARKGPRLDLSTRAGTVATATGALTRVETAAVLRLGVFEGTSAITATGRQGSTPVTALHQVQVPYGYLPGEVTPLALTDDSWEARLAAGLVSADQDLTRLADSLGGTDGVALLTSFRAAVPAAGSPRGEEALSIALARASRHQVDEVRNARNDGGSWGVIAALLGARVSAVSALLDDALAPASGPTLVAAAPSVSDLPGLLNPQPTLAPVPTRTPSTHKPTVKPPVTTPPTDPTTPSPGPVQGLVDTVLGLLNPPGAPATEPTVTPSPLLGLHVDLGGLGH